MSKVRLKTVKLIWLQSFLMLAECGNQMEASARLGRKQPQISAEIKELEKWLGKKLLRPTGRHDLTEEGRAFIPVASEVVDLALDCRAPVATGAKTLTFSWLTAFLKIAEYESHSEAARQLGWSQPSVSRYLDQLEAWLGKILFSDFDPAVITDDGEALLPVARRILELMDGSRSLEASRRPTVPITVNPKPPEQLEYDLYFEMQKLLEMGMEFKTERRDMQEWYDALHKKHKRRYAREKKS